MIFRSWIAFFFAGGLFALGAPLPNANFKHFIEKKSTTGALQKTAFYFGQANSISSIVIDHGTDQITVQQPIQFRGESVGWLHYEKSTGSMYAADAGGNQFLQVYQVFDQSLVSRSSSTFFAQEVVHLSLAKDGASTLLFGSAYGPGVLGIYSQDASQSISPVKTLSFGKKAKTHSSAVDTKRKLLFVANLGLGKINVYQLPELSQISEISIPSPRTVVFDSIYDKLYVSTEVSGGPSFIKGYAIRGKGPAYEFPEVASLSLPQRGADLKVNHARQYVMANARELGKESVWGMPVNAKGELDPRRPSFSIPLAQSEPRSLEVTVDGKYAVIAMNSSSAENVVVYRLTFDSENRYLSSQRVFAQKVGGQNIMCASSVPFF